MKVRNMTSPRTGRAIPNQFIIEDNEQNIWFQSYETMIAIKTPMGIWLDKNYWDYSTTTSKYRNRFLGETTQETKAKIKSGEYHLINLNQEAQHGNTH